MINRFQIGADGNTAHERWKMKKHKREIPEFGEKVLYEIPGTKGEDKEMSDGKKGIILVFWMDQVGY